MKINGYFGFTSSPFKRSNHHLYESNDYNQNKSRISFFLETEGIALIIGTHGLGKSTITLSYLIQLIRSSILKTQS